MATPTYKLSDEECERLVEAAGVFRPHPLLALIKKTQAEYEAKYQRATKPAGQFGGLEALAGGITDLMRGGSALGIEPAGQSPVTGVVAYEPPQRANTFKVTPAYDDCAHEWTAISDAFGNAVQGPCHKCGYHAQQSPGWFSKMTTSNPSLRGVPLVKDYTDAEIEKIKAEAFAAGKAAQRAEDEARIRAAYHEPNPVHRAMARHGRIGDVFAHRTYWIDES